MRISFLSLPQARKEKHRSIDLDDPGQEQFEKKLGELETFLEAKTTGEAEGDGDEADAAGDDEQGTPAVDVEESASAGDAGEGSTVVSASNNGGESAARKKAKKPRSAQPTSAPQEDPHLSMAKWWLETHHHTVRHAGPVTSVFP